MKVLVVDDEPAPLKQISKVISEARDPAGTPFEVEAVGDHRQALELLKNSRFDIVVTDMVLGREMKEGLEILRQLTEKSSVTIVLTAYPSIPNCVAAMKAGAWGYLEKVPEDGSDPYQNLLTTLREACSARMKDPDARKVDPDDKWVHEHLGELIGTYPGKVVAVLDQKVVGDAETYGELSKKLEGKFPLAKPTIISIPDTRVDAIE
jgi:DNA-binding NtrC family response regulator